MAQNLILTNATEKELNEYSKQCVFEAWTPPSPLDKLYKGVAVEDTNYKKLIRCFKYGLLSKVGEDNVLNLLTNVPIIDKVLANVLGEWWLVDIAAGKTVVTVK